MKYTLNRNSEGYIISVTHTQHDNVEIINLDLIDGKYLSCCKLNELTHMLEVDGAKRTEVDNEEHARKVQEEVAIIKKELASYDYIGTKIAMCVATKEEYATQIEYTEELRQRIRELENK